MPLHARAGRRVQAPGREALQLNEPESAFGIKDATLTRINGKVARYKPGVGIIVKDCNFMATKPEEGAQIGRGRDASRFALLSGFHPFHSAPSSVQHSRPLRNSLAIRPRADGTPTAV